MPASERIPVMTIEDAADLETFTAENARAMRDRLDHGARKFGSPLGWRSSFPDGEVVERLFRAEQHLEMAILRYREGVVFEDELRKRAADVANLAFMLADPLRKEADPNGRKAALAAEAARPSDDLTAALVAIFPSLDYAGEHHFRLCNRIVFPGNSGPDPEPPDPCNCGGPDVLLALAERLGGGDVSGPRTEAGRALLGLDVTPESGYWVNLSANEMRNAILAIEAEAARPSDDLTAAWARQEMEAQVRLRQTWFEAHPNQPMPEGRRWLAALSAEMPCLEDRGTDG